MGTLFWNANGINLIKLLRKRTSDKRRILCVIIGATGQMNQEKTPPFAKEEHEKMAFRKEI